MSRLQQLLLVEPTSLQPTYITPRCLYVRSPGCEDFFMRPLSGRLWVNVVLLLNNEQSCAPFTVLMTLDSISAQVRRIEQRVK